MVTIRLLGPPAIERGVEPGRQPRGRKAWALVGYLLLAERPPSRRRLAELFFADADDPLGALRWTLAELRRTIGVPDLLRGDPVVTSLGDTTVDALLLTQPSAAPESLLAYGGSLLEGMELESCPEFESWLLVERRRLAGVIEARLRQNAIALVAAGRAAEAIPFAAKAVSLNSLEQGNHELLIRSMAASGDRTSALRQIALCEDLFRRELGIEVTSALREAASVGPGRPSAPPLSGRAAAMSQLQAGRAAILAGAVDAGLQCLRQASELAVQCHDKSLEARALAALGSALVHAIRGHDEEGAIILQEALMVASEAGERATAVVAQRELGFVEVQAGRRKTGDEWLAKAQALAETDEENAAILGVRGMNSSDRSDYAAAFEQLGESVELAARCGDHRQQAWSLSLVGRAHLLRSEYSQAAASVAESLELVRRQRWIAFLPWPQALAAELDLYAGKFDTSAEGFEEAWTLGCQLHDPCWEGMAGRGLALVNANRGDYPAAQEWLDQALARSSHEPDRYQWVHAYVLDAAVATAIAHDDHERATGLANRMSSLAARCDMREMQVRAQLHLGHLGDRRAAASARSLSTDIDNPALADLLA
ncbi:DNA-binding SARP family transcriptional activator [Kribbella antiqua]|uniref:DNA-binding SARP family transcriptional activator n=1 Tax=Kribbella antiqua TaxID=2512217 RepID=A0A4R2IY69_9ACTN|nr:BTAD domain-containing putative transcriptional regulator [Kribbella antiqua]TCO50484.1 DNA-binding SARP family transcriptional activator [Kribbella antiqua]